MNKKISCASLCSGIEAPSVAWKDWEPLWFAEAAPFPSAVLQYHYNTVPNLGDITQIDYTKLERPDVLISGSPCQSFSIAGDRGGLGDARGALALATVRAVDALRPEWFVWENVTGALSSNKGRDFGAVLSALDDIGYNAVWAVLDAQWFGVPQQRRRLILLGHRDWRRAAQVLLEPEGQGIYPPKNYRGEEEGEWFWGEDITSCMTANYKRGVHCGGESYIRTSGLLLPDDYEYCSSCDDVWCSRCNEHFHSCSCLGISSEFIDGTYRRITPIEAERLQGLPDDYTLVPWRNGLAPDTRRYEAIGNSMAVPVIRWLGERIAATYS